LGLRVVYQKREHSKKGKKLKSLTKGLRRFDESFAAYLIRAGESFAVFNL